jgi:hypothetical protein
MYPELIRSYENTGTKHWGHLSEQNKSTLEIMQAWVASNRVEISILAENDLHEGLVLLRFLRANSFSKSKTQPHIQKSIQWRLSSNARWISAQPPEKLLGCSMEELTNVFPHWHSGYDKTGRPVIFKQYGKFDAGQIKALTGGNFDNLVKYHIWEQEACARLCLAQSKKLKAIIETITIVIDIKDMRMKQVNGDFITLVSLLAEIDGKQYPDTVGRIFVINATTTFAVAWQLVKAWVIPATASKMKVLGGPKEYIPVLQEFIGEENLPSNYGGTLPPLSPQVHPYAETMMTCFPGSVKAEGKSVGDADKSNSAVPNA